VVIAAPHEDNRRMFLEDTFTNNFQVEMERAETTKWIIARDTYLGNLAGQLFASSSHFKAVTSLTTKPVHGKSLNSCRTHQTVLFGDGLNRIERTLHSERNWDHPAMMISNSN
jgi:hypothetical protein